MLNIEPITLLHGHHADTGTTGQGCFMNVVAYLNGDAQITDESPCVCVTVRPLCIKLNDLGNAQQRQRLIPFIERAMGSATTDAAVIAERQKLLRKYSAECQAAIRGRADAYAYAYADALKTALFDAGLRFLDAALPLAQPASREVSERAGRLVEMAS